MNKLLTAFGWACTTLFLALWIVIFALAVILLISAINSYFSSAFLIMWILYMLFLLAILTWFYYDII